MSRPKVPDIKKLKIFGLCVDLYELGVDICWTKICFVFKFEAMYRPVAHKSRHILYIFVKNQKI